jgi:hypothetical protein
MFVTVALWGIGAGRIASEALHAHYGLLGLTSFATWLGTPDSLRLCGMAVHQRHKEIQSASPQLRLNELQGVIDATSESAAR